MAYKVGPCKALQNKGFETFPRVQKIFTLFVLLNCAYCYSYGTCRSTMEEPQSNGQSSQSVSSTVRGRRLSLFLLRVSLGWLFFYAGVTKLLNPDWTAAGYLKGAKTFAGFYEWLLTPNILPMVDFLNEWGLTLIGLSLLLGVMVRLSSVLGAILMLLYYFVVLDFPYPNEHSLIVDEHIIYAVALVVLAYFRAGRIWGLERFCSNLHLCLRFPKLRRWLG